jgi:hypothetical protein
LALADSNSPTRGRLSWITARCRMVLPSLSGWLIDVGWRKGYSEAKSVWARIAWCKGVSLSAAASVGFCWVVVVGAGSVRMSLRPQLRKRKRARHAHPRVFLLVDSFIGVIFNVAMVGVRCRRKVVYGTFYA